MDLKEAGYGLDRSGLGFHYRCKTCTRLDCICTVHVVRSLNF